jgi:hypothetical protein
MMKNLLIILFTGLFSSVVVAQSNPIQDPVTTIVFESTTVNYGKIEKGSDGIRTFTFKNTGKNPLKIYKIYSSYTCEILSKPQDPIAPGQTGEIKVKYETKKVGPIVKTITVYANIDKSPIPLRLKGEVIPKNN